MKTKTTQLFFDCDNTLVKSEDLAFDACADLCNQILEQKGFADRYTSDQLLIDFVGQNFRGMTSKLQQKYGFEFSKEEREFYVKAEENAVIAKIEAKAEACDGSGEVLDRISKNKEYNMAVVSSSATRRIRAALAKADHGKYFADDGVSSAVNSLPKPTSKPDPAVYVHAMAKIGVKPEQCITVEDSKSGAASAVRAGIPCIAYVGCYHGDRKQKEVADMLTTVGCKTVMYHWTEFERCVAEIEAM